YFFFSSRRRHTRFSRDWSSDVCSSDLYISFQNFIDHQRLSAWDWDDNQFTTNQIDHPFHGSLYFNAFRSNGYNFYQSSLATIAGSYIWETAGETQHPSINDLVNT